MWGKQCGEYLLYIHLDKWNEIEYLIQTNVPACSNTHDQKMVHSIWRKQDEGKIPVCLIYGYLSTNITNYYHFKFVFINQTKIKVSKIYIFLVKNVLFTPVLMLKLKLWFIHYISITCTNLCGNISAVYAKTSRKNVETLRWTTGLSYFKSLLVSLMCAI